jgi:isopenicillin N synthase-like dioxygenase
LTPPLLHAGALDPEVVDGALRAWGGFSLETRESELPWRAALLAAHTLFALPRTSKAEIAIERSPHFRGWSEMHNERDWREQLHLGRERPSAGAEPPFLRLDGPNLWPPAAAWRAPILDYMDAAAALGEAILGAVAQALALPDDPFAGVAAEGYLVAKLIGYHPQASTEAPRPGVAPHLDFSWLTLTAQDAPGLEVRAPDGAWTLIEPRPGVVWVHAGELLAFATRGRYAAAPHRVINRSSDRTRVSIPLFVNPPLTAQVPVLVGPPGPEASELPGGERAGAGEHVHRVLSPDEPAVPFHFGESEWRRKGLDRWCAVCVPPG